MRPDYFAIGDAVEDSPVGPGTITDISEAGYPRVSHVAVGCLRRTDGVVFDPFGHYRKQVSFNLVASGKPASPVEGGTHGVKNCFR